MRFSTVAALCNALAIVAALPALADGTAAAQYRTGALRVDIQGTEVGMQLRLPMTRADASTAALQSLAPAEVVARLKAGRDLFVFPAEGRCELDSANAFVVDTQGRPTTGDGNIQAMFRFRCDGAAAHRMERLTVRLFEQLPGLEKVRLTVDDGRAEHAEEATPGANAVKL